MSASKLQQTLSSVMSSYKASLTYYKNSSKTKLQILSHLMKPCEARLKQITIWDNHYTIELKSSLKVEVER